MPENFDLAVVGAGPGGYVAAIRAAQLGLSVAIVDKREHLGGTCLNIGCIPSKALLDSSELYLRTRQDLTKHGILVDEPRLDLAAMMRRKDQIVQKFTGGVSLLMKQNGIATYRGSARLPAPGVLEITSTGGASSKSGKTRLQSTDRASKSGKIRLEAEKILLATGSTPATLSFLPFDGKDIISSTEALALEEVPSRMVVVGGGAIGLELGSVWSRLGAEVTVVELMPQLLPGWDERVAGLLKRLLSDQGLKFHLSTTVTGCRKRQGTLTLGIKDGSGKEGSLTADKVLVAVGRRPYVEGLGLAELDLARDEKSGLLTVDRGFQTSIPGIYAIGDLIQGPMLAHKAEEEGIAAAEIMAGLPGEVNYHSIPGVVYTWPEVASLGQTESQLKEAGIAFNRGMAYFRANGRALAADSSEGFVKILADRKSDRLLGVQIIGPWASDLISEVVAVLEFAGSAEDIARTVHAHPTLSEVLREAALDVAGRALHGPPAKKKG